MQNYFKAHIVIPFCVAAASSALLFEFRICAEIAFSTGRVSHYPCVARKKEAVQSILRSTISTFRRGEIFNHHYSHYQRENLFEKD